MNKEYHREVSKRLRLAVWRTRSDLWKKVATGCCTYGNAPTAMHLPVRLNLSRNILRNTPLFSFVSPRTVPIWLPSDFWLFPKLKKILLKGKKIRRRERKMKKQTRLRSCLRYSECWILKECLLKWKSGRITGNITLKLKL